MHIKRALRDVEGSVDYSAFHPFGCLQECRIQYREALTRAVEDLAPGNCGHMRNLYSVRQINKNDFWRLKATQLVVYSAFPCSPPGTYMSWCSQGKLKTTTLISELCFKALAAQTECWNKAINDQVAK